MKRILVSATLVLVILLSACGSWTPTLDDPSDCSYGKKLTKIIGEVSINPIDDHSTTLWQSSNGEACGKTEGEAVGGYDANWFQIVNNKSGDFMINVRAFEKKENDYWPGWVNCEDVTFLDDLKSYEDRLTVEYYNRLEGCYQVSHK